MKTFEEEIKELVNGIKPVESAAVTIAFLHGREEVPKALEKYLAPAMYKLLQIGWLTYTREMAKKEIKSANPKLPSKRKTRRKVRSNR